MESPGIRSSILDAIGDIYTFNLDTRELTNLTKDDFADYAPTFSPDGKFIVYVVRVSGSHHIFVHPGIAAEARQLEDVGALVAEALGDTE